MTKRDLVVRISNETGLVQQQVLTVIQKTLDYVIEALVRACESGEVPFKEAEASEARLRALKERFLAGYADPDPKAARLAAGRAEHRALAEEIAERSGIPA